MVARGGRRAPVEEAEGAAARPEGATMTEPVFGSYAQMMRETDYARFAQEHRGGGSLGLEMFVAHQGPMEMEDPPCAQVAFTSVLAAEGPMEFAFNAPWNAQPLRAGGFSMQPARQACGFRTRHPHTILVVGVDERRLMTRLDEAGVRGDPFAPLYGCNEPLPEVVRLMRRVWAATEAQGPAANLLVDGLFAQALGLILRACDPGRRIAPPPDLADGRLARVVDYVEAHLERPMTVEELAGVAGVSMFHFTRVFRAATGLTPHAHVQARRVERAKRLLAGPMPLAEVAFAAGFASQSHMGQVFRRATGLTPGAWRAEARG